MQEGMMTNTVSAYVEWLPTQERKGKCQESRGFPDG